MSNIKEKMKAWNDGYDSGYKVGFDKGILFALIIEMLVYIVSLFFN